MTPAPQVQRRPMTNLTGLGRSSMQSHFRAAQEKPPAGMSRPPIQNFESEDIWPWITTWLKATYQTDIEGLFVPSERKHAFNTYPDTGEQGHYDLSSLAGPDGSIRIAVAGDWGTGTDAAQQVADSMVSNNPELTIHLGDIYYVGLPSDVAENCLGVNTGEYFGVLWKHGSKGSLALNGNHEMYSGGHGYFEKFLPTLGIPSSNDKQQLASFFCLESKVWRILAIDTGYNSDTLFGDCSLEKGLLDWLRDKINPEANRKPTVLLSHHQWFSGFEDGDYTKPADQIAPFLPNQEIVWLWGHEHRLAIYYPYKDPKNHLNAYGRCIGHGGMPIEMPKVQPNGDRAQRVEYWDGLTELHKERFTQLPNKSVVGRNGFVEMQIKDSTLTIEYLDSDRTSVLKESFMPGGGAVWDGTLVRTVVSDPQILEKMIYE